ncbi:replication initiator protein [Coconut foliar decay alphasatellite 7]|uniref:Replication initiator protein n=1 Tax=Coconut foliar decay alphasatellite 7 TaxID=2161880 RepID=A0A2R4N9B7_9VIRU|nr:replication initiator protein [Coconut foliar decay alphasatellite 7]AVX29436.1 replication initiator protein [Coconut foliar decay alphasatellite 7]
MASQVRRWVLTFNYSDESAASDLVRRIESLKLIYGIIGDEIAPTTGQRHLQGFLHLAGRGRTLEGLKKTLENNTVHLEPAKGSDQQNKIYCSKENVLFEHGVPTRPGSKRKLYERYEEDAEELRIEEPGAYRRCKMIEKQKKWNYWVLNNPFPYDLYQWQEELMEVLQEPADNRTILWICGRDGGDGKTEFGKYLGLNEKWFYSCGGKTRDVLYQYIEEPERNFILDVPRCNDQYMNYALIECIKNRAFSSDKYEPLQYLGFDKVHVIVLCNFLPDYLKISEDRIKLWNI